MAIEEDDIRRLLIFDLKDKEKDLTSLDDALIKARKEHIELEGREKFFNLRDNWSTWIIFWITSLIASHIAIAILVGIHQLDYENYQWLIPTLVIENFLEIIGMGYIVVKFLYPASH